VKSPAYLNECAASKPGAFGHKVLHMENADTVQIRLLEESDPPSIAAAFTDMGWNKPETQYRRYLREQVAGTRTCFIGIIDGQFAGYVTVNWRPTYTRFSDLSIPEIQDLNVLAKYRRKGIARRLLDRAEGEAARRSGVVGIAVGLHPGYNAAQRLYVKRGYIPDGRGITYRNYFVKEGANVVLDDDLVMHFTKELPSSR
jgi:GNAT superfamily N-acetyltransferase